jgi:isoleucyl-tRNA synthetase
VAEPNKYKETCSLPQTDFPMKGDLATREPEILARWEKADLYGRIQAARGGAPRFVFHDGPPYSNGHIHYGHILNKTLKDIVVKSRTMAGFATPYVPGWDTHGLPIELAVERELRGKQLPPAEVRAACKAFALRFVDIQRAEMKRLGILCDWDHPYLTLDPSYEATIARALATFARGGWLYRGKKPVVWCPRDKTALAEAEIEYEDHESPSIYVRFPLEGRKETLVIWTTTPWTLPANLAIVAHPLFEYVAIQRGDERLIIAKELAEKFGEATKIDVSRAEPFDVRALEGARYTHPFVAWGDDKAGRLWLADYVTADTGTGLVHTAPGHGADDYKTGVAHGLPAYAPLDDAGRFVAGSPLDLAGKSTDEANPIIVDHLARHGFLLNKPGETISHQYAHCWRCKGPIIYRATPQWFIRMDHGELRERALAAIDRTTWVPPWGRDRIHGMIANRPDWVLSRQRLWGTPIPVFYCTACGTEHANADTMDHVAAIFEREGADAWWTRAPKELVPADTRCASCGAGADKLDKEKDIVDVWFESGCSWLAMAARDGAYRDNDLYLEGSDQHRGWFHSSLLVAIGVQGKAPYGSVITHGFVLDENGIPYSKSTIEKAKAEGKQTSYIEPDSVIKKSGAEMFRLWVASTEFRTDITYSQKILDNLAEWYRKLRNTARFLLGNLGGFAPDAHDRSVVTLGIDRYMLAKLDAVVAQARQAYEKYDLQLVHRLLVEFVTVEISALYGEVVKDRLYCDAIDSPRRRAAQVVLYECVRAIATLGAPILSFTAEDIWAHMPKRKGDPDSVHLALFPPAREPAAAIEFEKVLAWRERVTKALEPFRAAKHKSDDATVTLPAPELRPYADELADLFVVSRVELVDSGDLAVAEHLGPACARCRKHYDKLAASPPDVCERCADALARRAS